MYLLNPNYKYKWNMALNLTGDIGRVIRYDSCVEIQFHNIKRQLNTQGSNKSSKTASQICITTLVLDAMKNGLISID